MSGINKQKYLAELTKLLGFMSSWDREAALEKYGALYDECATEDEVAERLGSPTRLAIAIARDYIPTAPEPKKADPAPDEETPSGEADDRPAPADEAPAAELGDLSPAPETPLVLPALDDAKAALDEPKTPAKAAKAPGQRRKLRPLVFILYLIPAVVIGVPVAAVSVALGIPFFAAGAALAVGAVYIAVQTIPQLTMVSDVLMLAGAGLVCCAAALLLAWFGLWLSLTLGSAWIRLVLRLGSRLCYKKEAAE